MSKLCTNCNITKSLTEYYKAGLYYQKHCKLCFNIKSTTRYSNNKRVTPPKLKGFAKLHPVTQNQIIYAVHRGDTIKSISVFQEIKYTTLMSWKKNGKIPIILVDDPLF
jgi:hypothetical protein